MILKAIADDEDERLPAVIGGDLNARIGEELSDDVATGRLSRDKLINEEGRRLLEWVNERGWTILNGTTPSDRSGQWTFVGARGSSVIDYVIANRQANEKVLDMEVQCRVESDHLPLVVTFSARTNARINSAVPAETARGEKGHKVVWSERNIRAYQSALAEGDGGDHTEKSVKDTEQWIRAALRSVTERDNGEIKPWEAANLQKRTVRASLSKALRQQATAEQYLKEKAKWIAITTEVKKNRAANEAKAIRQLRNCQEIWKYLKNEQRKRPRAGYSGDIGQCKTFFIEALEGLESCTEHISENLASRIDQEQIEITAEEVRGRQ